ncbi:hypothetical protein ADIMK_1879 [Marinobacterium lacunae]|uniref:Uncharacterized protein n=1 Tax=Marinobacterium lacunae TaxID=1232683 RepID=A0A081FZF3_9GAMM|nr:hypothetical protein [Marinobacterium lacunae]KEA63908.1 hypothetical protein ADIMK_1879 [Marinobacterium lacunae]
MLLKRAKGCVNNRAQLCADFALEAALGRDEPLASTSMPHRFEAGMDRQVIIESYPVL